MNEILTVLGNVLIVAGALVDSGSYALAFGVTGLLSLLATIPWARARETLTFVRLLNRALYSV